MRLPNALATLSFAATMLPLAASATNWGFLYDSPQSYFKPEDRKLAENTLSEALEKGDVDAKRTWKNEKTGNEGTVTVTAAKGSCRTVTIYSRAHNGINNTSTVELCKQPDGTWKIPAR